jgi:hypothetical protein
MQMEKKPKIWADGMSVKASLRNGKSLISTSYNVEKFCAFLRKHANEKGYVNVDSWEKDQPGKFGDTHSASLNDYKPTSKPANVPQEEEADLPF